MAEETLDEQINRLLRNELGSATTDQEKMLGQSRINQAPVDLRMDPGSAMTNQEIDMINSAQMGLMEIDPSGTKDIIDGLEVTKKKVMAGGQLSEGESSGIMSILQKIGGALSGLMGDGAEQTLQQVMVDGNVAMLTAKEIMSAKNAGMLVQPVDVAIREMEMNK
jgi:hypothetical protein